MHAFEACIWEHHGVSEIRPELRVLQEIKDADIEPGSHVSEIRPELRVLQAINFIMIECDVL